MPDGTDRDAENAAAAEEILASVAGEEPCVLNHTGLEEKERLSLVAELNEKLKQGEGVLVVQDDMEISEEDKLPEEQRSLISELKQLEQYPPIQPVAKPTNTVTVIKDGAIKDGMTVSLALPGQGEEMLFSDTVYKFKRGKGGKVILKPIRKVR